MRSSRHVLWPRRGSSGRRGRVVALNMVLALVAVLVPTTMIPAGAADDPVQISFTLEGCRNNGTVLLPNGDGDFICADPAYTTGNLGKGWNELDLVPHRVTLDNDGAAQTYTFVVAGDYKNGSGTGVGWDYISDLTLNASSPSSCPATLTGTTTITPSGEGVGGADQTIYKSVTIAQPANTTCVYDYYQRLALGAHNFSGSSLQSNLWNQSLTSSGIGQKRLSLPVKEVKPQELSKTMVASQGSDHIWNVSKTAPESLSFGDTCLDTTSSLSQPVSITVSWERLAASPNGDITVITTITATNPASRMITVTVTDQLYTGDQAIGGLEAIGTHDVPGHGSYEFPSTTTVLPANTVLLGGNLNDLAIATYADPVTHAPIPGSVEARASTTVVSSTSELNQTATITDVESIAGSGFSYSVDSFSGAEGDFDGGYEAGDETTAPVSWTSDSQTDSGSVTFQKTVYATAGLTSTGSLSDTATLAGSDGFPATASASVDLSASATVSLTINKSIPDVLTGDETASFEFDVINAEGVVGNATITFAAGDTDRSAVVSGLDPGTYTVHEVADPTGQWATQDDESVTIILPDCAGSVAFNNTPNPVGISLDKTVNGADHATVEDALLAHSGDPLTYSVVITNTGLVAVTITSLTDTLRDPDFDGTCTQGIGSVLEPGDSFTCTYPMTAAGDATNLATVIGVDGLDRDVTAHDSTFVDVINPTIEVVKTVDDETPVAGQTVTYTYVVTNTGDTTLSGVTIVDNVLGGIAEIGTLAPGASATATKTMVVGPDSPKVNIATAEGTDVLGKTVTDDDDATIAVTTVAGIVEVKPDVLPAVLPRTGAAIGGILLLGFALLLGGLALRSTRRRQPLA